MPLIIVKPTLQKEYSPSRYLGEKQITFVGWCRALDKTGNIRIGDFIELRESLRHVAEPGAEDYGSIDLPAELG